LVALSSPSAVRCRHRCSWGCHAPSCSAGSSRDGVHGDDRGRCAALISLCSQGPSGAFFTYLAVRQDPRLDLNLCRPEPSFLEICWLACSYASTRSSAEAVISSNQLQHKNLLLLHGLGDLCDAAFFSCSWKLVSL
jgi:hypothetical protein